MWVLDEKEYCVTYFIHGDEGRQCFENETLYKEFIQNLSKMSKGLQELPEKIIYEDTIGNQDG